MKTINVKIQTHYDVQDNRKKVIPVSVVNFDAEFKIILPMNKLVTFTPTLRNHCVLKNSILQTFESILLFNTTFVSILRSLVFTFFARLGCSRII